MDYYFYRATRRKIVDVQLRSWSHFLCFVCSDESDNDGWNTPVSLFIMSRIDSIRRFPCSEMTMSVLWEYSQMTLELNTYVDSYRNCSTILITHLHCLSFLCMRLIFFLFSTSVLMINNFPFIQIKPIKTEWWILLTLFLNIERN